MRKFGFCLFAFIIYYLPGCASLTQSMKTYTQTDVTAADASNDMKTLEGVCSGKLKEEDYSGAKKLACTRLEIRQDKARIVEAEEKSDLTALDGICMNTKIIRDILKEACAARDRVIAAEFGRKVAKCEDVRDAWSWRAKLDPHDAGKWVFHPAMTREQVIQTAREAYKIAFKKYVECGLWNEVFEDLMGYIPLGWVWADLPPGRYLGRVALQEQQDAGVDVELRFGEYIKKSSGKLFPNNPEASAGEVAQFLAKNSKFKHCSTLAPLVAAADAGVIYQWLPFFEVAGCKEARSVAVVNLTASHPYHRIQACLVLGKIGTKAELPKVKALAEGDGFSEIVNRVQIYPVRDRCSSAAANISVRGK